MGGSARIPTSGDLEREIKERMKGDDTARSLKRLYNRGLILGIGVLALSVVLFCGAMFLIVAEQSLLNVIMAGIAVVLLVVCIIVVPIRLRKLQSGWFGAASDATEDYAKDLIQKLTDDQQPERKK